MLFSAVPDGTWNTSVAVQCAPPSVDRDTKMLLKVALFALVCG
jgi:hypothetical protein